MNKNFFFDAAFSMGVIDSWMPPFIGVPPDAPPSKGALHRRFDHFLNSGIPFSVQLLGHDADSMAETAVRLWECGVKSVNLNFACPSKTVLGSGSGGAVLKEPERAAKIVSAILLRAPHICLSVKLRSGFVSSEETSEIVKQICGVGVSWLLFHFRTVSENYLPLERKEALRRISAAVVCAGKVPVFGNGDVLTVEDARLMRQETACAGVAVGRGFLRNPFLLKEIRGFDSEPDAQKQFLNELLARAENGSGDIKYDFYVECIKMAYGKESEEFKSVIRKRAELYSVKSIFHS